jgi:hypothetical protein
VRNRLDASAEGSLTPLVGRDQELGLLLDRWRSVVDGQGQVVLVTGDPGIGKSWLVRRYRAAASRTRASSSAAPPTTPTARCTR